MKQSEYEIAKQQKAWVTAETEQVLTLLNWDKK